MKKYETYKETGIEWIGEIPEGWTFSKIKYVFSFGRGLNITKADLTETGIPVISYGQVHAKYNTGTGVSESLLRYIPEEFTIGKDICRLKTGDFVFADTSEDKEGCGNCVYIDREGIFAGYHSLVLKGHDRDNKYFAYLFKSDEWRAQIRAKASGVKVYSITQSIMSDCTILLPPVEEQQAIASFLDYKVSQIDKSISAINTEIDNLKKYRQSLISETVTKGLNPDAKMKDSGIEWIGLIPERWNVIRLSHLTIKIGSGKTPTGGAEVYTDNGVMFIRSQNVYNEGLRIEDVTYISEEINQTMLNSKVLFSDVLLNITGGSIGRSCMISDVNINANVNQHVCIIRSKQERILPKFLHYYIISSSIQNQIKACQTGSNREELNFEQIGKFLITLPSLSEQQTIADYLDSKTQKIDAAIARLEQEKDIQAKYKQSLISEAVTGKIDVREWKPSK